MLGLNKGSSVVERKVPLWVLLLCILLGGVFLIVFGWALKSTISGDQRSGSFGKWAVDVASFPELSEQVFAALRDRATGDYLDEAFRVPRPNKDLSGFAPVAQAEGIDVSGLLIRADRAKLTPGWRLVAGSFVIDGQLDHAVLLLSPALKIVKMWKLDEVPVDGKEPQPKHRTIVHGLTLLDDLSLIYTFAPAVSLQRIDRCSKRQWTIGGNFNHSVTPDDAGASVWTLRDSDILQVAVADGAVLRRITMDDIIAANPDIDILELRRLHPDDLNGNSRNTDGSWMEDPFHVNDVEPLPAAYADRFKGLAAGDLLVSARSLNLLFVIDPKTLKVKWWRVGATQRQHDPDWQPNGEISVLNNRMSRDYSEILSIDPSNLRTKVLLDGRRNDFYTRIRGEHQITPGGDVLIASPQQGRAIEVNKDGDVVLELVNTKPGSATLNYLLTTMRWLPPDAINGEEVKCANLYTSQAR